MSERESDRETTEERVSPSANMKDIKKRKNKKTKKRRTGGGKAKVSSEDFDENEDEITRATKLVDKMFGTSTGHPSTPQTEIENAPMIPKSLLSVQHKNLNPQMEMKKMFGKIVNTDQQRRRRGDGRNFRTKSVYMANPKENWPPVNRTGVFMNLVQNTDASPPNGAKQKNLMYFSFEHSPSYRSIQQKFLQSVESIDSNNIVKIINMQPYHIDVSCYYQV